MLDELLLGGEVQESSKKNVLKAIAAQDLLQEVYACLVVSLYSVTFFANSVYCVFLMTPSVQNIFCCC